MQLDTITELLNIPNYKVTHIVQQTPECLHFVLAQIAWSAPICSACGRIHHSPIHSTQRVVVEDLQICGKRVFLHVLKRKSWCPEDDTVRVEEIEWIKGRFTSRFVDHVYRLTAITTNQEAGWYLGLDDETVYRIDRAMLEERALLKLDPIPVPMYMSVDEVAWQKWHKYVTNVVDIEQRTVIWNYNNRGKSVLDRFYQSLGADNCKKITAIASDGATGFLSSTREHAPHALIVLDHFHVKKYLNDAVDTVRKEELKQARQHQDEDLCQILHCNQRFILMQNTVTDKKRDLLEKLARLNNRLYQAMLLKEQFLSIYTATNRTGAWTNLKAWIITAIKSGIPAFVELGYKFFRKRHYILNYFICKITAAISEGINNKIKRLKRMAYGYRDVTYFLLKIHQHCGLLNPKLST
jgi:transposase